MQLSLLSIHSALISVFNKSKILKFAQALTQKNIELLSTGGTAMTLSNARIPVSKISDYIQFPEIMHGRIKTLHPKIYAGILNKNNIYDNTIEKYDIKKINMIVTNFYPFESIIKKNKYSHDEILEYIDIGGPSMVRAAIKNYKNVVVIIDPNDYQSIIDELYNQNGLISLHTRLNLAIKALTYITKYDDVITNYFQKKYTIQKNTKKNHNQNQNQNQNQNIQYKNLFPKKLNIMNIKFIKKQNIRYGENPHQKAALYAEKHTNKSILTGTITAAKQLQGKPLSYNNIIDMDTALECVKIFKDPTCVIVKHTNPCSVATSHNIYDAYQKAYQSDPISAFGGILAFNRPIDKKTALSIVENQFVEAIIAPNVHYNCNNIFSKKKYIRILICGPWNIKKIDFDLKRITGGLLIQDYDFETNIKKLSIVTTRYPTKKEMEDALFCWKIVKFIKSNAIVCGKKLQTTGMGIGQTNRVLSVKIATKSFQETQNNTKSNIPGSTMASDAFFPFPDSIHIAGKKGICCIIQPGGSIRDKEIITIANQYNIAMIFTHTRHFRH